MKVSVLAANAAVLAGCKACILLVQMSGKTVARLCLAASKSGLEQQVQLCIDYIVDQDTDVDFDLVRLASVHANQLLAALQKRLCAAQREVKQAQRQLGAAISRISTANTQRDKLVQQYGTKELRVFKCSSGGKRWIAGTLNTVACCGNRSAASVTMSLDQV